MTDLKANYARVEERVREALHKAGDADRRVTIVAVTKTVPIETVREFVSLSLTAHLGESRGQELRDKAAALDSTIQWNFIGPIQTNKVKYIARDAALVHSVDSRDIIDELDKRCAALNRSMDILIQVNISNEAQKGGVAPDAAETLIAAAKEKEHLSVRGLMGIASLSDDAVAVEREFALLRDLRDTLSSRYPSLTELSMGMSSDFGSALKYGATILRIGSLIFGERG
ncbi:MAG: YggS family pyridoxal phosphate-dependent enzyme [Spirochaetota bacterium]